jgi:hypothetical protein
LEGARWNVRRGSGAGVYMAPKEHLRALTPPLKTSTR